MLRAKVYSCVVDDDAAFTKTNTFVLNALPTMLNVSGNNRNTDAERQ